MGFVFEGEEFVLGVGGGGGIYRMCVCMCVCVKPQPYLLGKLTGNKVRLLPMFELLLPLGLYCFPS